MIRTMRRVNIVLIIFCSEILTGKFTHLLHKKQKTIAYATAFFYYFRFFYLKSASFALLSS